MATNNAVNTSLSSQTGTGSFVGSSSPTIGTPLIAQINDPTQNLPVIKFSNPASSVNQLTIAGQVTNNPPEVQATGTDSNIGINLRCKGTIGVQILSEATSVPFTILSGTAFQHQTRFSFSNTSATRTVTFPDATGTVALSGTGQTVSFGDMSYNSGYGSSATVYGTRAWVNFNGTGTVAIRGSGNVSSITDNGTGDYTVNYTNALPDANYAFIATGSYFASNYLGIPVISMSGTSTPTLYSTTQTRFLSDNPQTDTRQDAGYLNCSVIR